MGLSWWWWCGSLSSCSASTKAATFFLHWTNGKRGREGAYSYSLMGFCKRGVAFVQCTEGDAKYLRHYTPTVFTPPLLFDLSNWKKKEKYLLIPCFEIRNRVRISLQIELLTFSPNVKSAALSNQPKYTPIFSANQDHYLELRLHDIFTTKTITCFN